MVFLIDLATYSIMVSLLPEASRLMHGGACQAYIWRTFLQCGAFALCLLPLFLFAEPIIRTLFSPVYASSAHLFRILFWGSFASMLVYPMNLVLYARDKVRAVVLGNALQLAVAGIGYATTTARFGAEGTAWSAVAGRLAGCVVFSFGAEGTAWSAVAGRLAGCVVFSIVMARMMRAPNWRATSRSQAVTEAVTG
jgi:O-antigen/teichoic acid export membrane protein